MRLLLIAAGEGEDGERSCLRAAPFLAGELAGERAEAGGDAWGGEGVLPRG